MTPGDTDVLVLGGGSAGYACALRAALLGMRVTLIEASKLGGTCLHRGCIPTKALLHAAELADTARAAGTFGVRLRFDGIDMAAVQEYKDSTVDRLHRGLAGLVKSRQIRVVPGVGKLVGERTVEVNGARYTGRSLVLATGSYSRSLPEITTGARVLTSDSALALEDVPSSVVVLGGGVIGVEFASLWRSFGSEVTIVEALDRLLPAEDEWVCEQLGKALRRRGIAIRTGARVQQVRETSQAVEVTLEGAESLFAERVLLAVGRGPNTADIGLEQQGVDTDNGFIVTDARLRTSAAGVYAVGDVVHGPQLAHRGFQHGIFVAEDIAGLDPPVIDEALIPRVTYSHPEIASVGLTEAAARARYGRVNAVVYDLAGNGKSQILRTSGAIKLIRAGDDGPVVGAHMVGDRVGELIGEAQLAVAWEALPGDVAPLIHAHPTQNEAIGEAFLALAGKPLHAHS